MWEGEGEGSARCFLGKTHFLAIFANVSHFLAILDNFWKYLATFAFDVTISPCHEAIFSSCHLVISSYFHLIILSFFSLIACKFVNLSIYQLVNLIAFKLVSFSACSSWSLRACFVSTIYHPELLFWKHYFGRSTIQGYLLQSASSPPMIRPRSEVFWLLLSFPRFLF